MDVKEDASVSRSSRRKPLVTRRIIEAKEVPSNNGDESFDTNANGGADDDGNDADMKAFDNSDDYAHIYENTTTPAGGSTKESTPDDVLVDRHHMDSADDESTKTEPELNVDEHGNIILPEGTEYVEPEAVHDSHSIIEGPEFRQTRATGTHTKTAVGSITCTACNKQINTNLTNAAKRHPMLNVLLCQRCFRFYHHEGISKDADGSDEQCRWCGEGGSLICCDFCNNSFCKSCIKRNLGRTELALIMDADENSKWRCYVCDPKPLAPLIANCDQVLEEMEVAAKKAEEKYRKEQLKLKQKADRVKSPPASAAFTSTGLNTSVGSVGSLAHDDAGLKQTARKSCGGSLPRDTVAAMLAQARVKVGNAVSGKTLGTVLPTPGVAGKKHVTSQPIQVRPGVPLFVKETPESRSSMSSAASATHASAASAASSSNRNATASRSVIGKTSVDRSSASAQQVKWTDSDVPITHQNVDIVLNATLSASQSMNNLLVALRDELRKITAGKQSEQERQLRQEQVALKLRRSLLTFKHSFMEIERFARNLQTTTPVMSTAAAPPKAATAATMGSAASLLMQQAQQVRSSPTILRNSPSAKQTPAVPSKSSNTALGQLLTTQRVTTTSAQQRSAVRQAQGGNGVVVYRNQQQQQRGTVPPPPPLVAMPTLASSSVLSKALQQSSLPMPAPLPPPPPSVIVMDVIELSDDEDDKNNGRVNGGHESTASDGPRDSENGEQSSDDGGARKKRRLEGLLTGRLTEEEVLAEIRESAAQRASNGMSLFTLDSARTSDTSAGTSQNKLFDKVKRPSNTARKGMGSSRGANGASGDGSDLKTGAPVADNNSQGNGCVPDLQVEGDEAPRLSPAVSDVPVISPQGDEETALPQLDGLYDDDDDEENRNGGRPSRKRKSDGQSVGYRVVPVVADSSSSDDSRASTLKRPKKAGLNDVILALTARERDIEKERQLHLALMTEESDHKNTAAGNAVNLPGASTLQDGGSDDEVGSVDSSEVDRRQPRKCVLKLASTSNGKLQSGSAKLRSEKVKQADGKPIANNKKTAESKDQGRNSASGSKPKRGSARENSDDSSVELSSDTEVSASDDDDFKPKNTRTSSKQRTGTTRMTRTQNVVSSGELQDNFDSVDREIAKLSKLPGRSRKGGRQNNDDSSTSSKAEKKQRPTKKKNDLSSPLSSLEDGDDSVGGANTVNEEENPATEAPMDTLAPGLKEEDSTRAALLAAMRDSDDGIADSDVEDILARKVAKEAAGSSKSSVADGADTKDEEADDDEDVGVSKVKAKRDKLLRAPLFIRDEDGDNSKGSSGSISNKKGKKAGSKTKKVVSNSGNDSDFEAKEAAVESSDSDFQTPQKKLKKRRSAKKSGSVSGEEEEEEEQSDVDEKKAKKKRRRIKKIDSDSSGDNDSDGGDDEDVGSEDDTEDTPGKGRKKIRKIIKEKNLSKEAKDAAKAEEERRARIEERQKLYNELLMKESGQAKDEASSGRLILERDKKTMEVVIEVPEDVLKHLKPHQIEAVQFMWNCCIENLDQLKKTNGSGCILAHCMGLGKTLSVISFVYTLMTYKKLTGIRRVLIICPLNTVLNWANEWAMWVGEDTRPDVYELSSMKDNWGRCDQLEAWHASGGVMIMGYEMFRNLSQHSRIKKKKMKETFTKTLLDPGPDFVICDEGHLLKNDASKLSQAVNQIKTPRRIALTGTPLQNNLLEYHCMVSLVKPSLLGTRKEFANRFVNPITNGQHSDSTLNDVKIMKKRAHILHQTLAGCVQRKDYSELCKFLGPKLEYVVLVRLSPLQITLYEKYLAGASASVEGQTDMLGRGGRLFNDYNFLMRICAHPWLLKLHEVREENKRMYDDEDSFIDDSEEESEMSYQSSSDDSSKKKKSKKGDKKDKKSKKKESSVESVSSSDADEDEGDDKKRPPKKGEEVVRKWQTRSRNKGADLDGEPGLVLPETVAEDQLPEQLSREWWAEFMSAEDQYKVELSGKLVVIAEILRQCEEIGDKVLVFSQSLLALDLIEGMLEYWDGQGKNPANTDKLYYGGNWTKNTDYFRMDGSTSGQLRKAWADQINDPENTRARLFLISTKAGGLGINLVGANRVIMFDASWNPSHDSQSMFRVYRYGQTKPVYVYRLVAQGTMEEKIYERQVTKQSLSHRVIDEFQIDRHFSSADLVELYRFNPDRLDDPNRKERPTPILPKDLLLADLLTEQKAWIVSYHEHDSLLENKIDEGLSEEDRKAAWDEYNLEKQGIRRQIMMPANQMTGSAMSMEQVRRMQQAAVDMTRRIMASDPNMPPDQVQAYVNVAIQQLIQEQRRQEQIALMWRQQQQQQQLLRQQQPGGGALSGLQQMQQQIEMMRRQNDMMELQRQRHLTPEQQVRDRTMATAQLQQLQQQQRQRKAPLLSAALRPSPSAPSLGAPPPAHQHRPIAPAPAPSSSSSSSSAAAAPPTVDLTDSDDATPSNASYSSLLKSLFTRDK